MSFTRLAQGHGLSEDVRMLAPGELRSLRIAIADDHPVIRMGLKALLQTQENWTICGEASDGEAALDIARALMPDVMVIDYSLPLMNGVEATRRLKARHPSIGVIIYTMHLDDTLIRSALSAGAKGYVLKVDEDALLIGAVKAVSNGKRYFSQSVSEMMLDTCHRHGELVDGDTLTNREREVIQLVAEGASNGAIAKRWGVSIKTVDSHRTSAMRKLHLKTAVDLTRYAIRNKIIMP